MRNCKVLNVETFKVANIYILYYFPHSALRIRAAIFISIFLSSNISGNFHNNTIKVTKPIEVVDTSVYMYD